MGKDNEEERYKLLEDMGTELSAAAYGGFLTPEFPIPIEVSRVVVVNGPRAGALELHAGLEAGKLLQALSRNSAAVLRQFIPWTFLGDPACYMFGRAVRVEAPWPEHLAETEVRLSDLSLHPTSRVFRSSKSKAIAGGRWVAGKAETGQTITLGLNNTTPTWLVGGTTGAGKSTFFHVLVAQIGLDPSLHEVVLIDAKYGDGLNPVANLPAVRGPVATNVEQARAALAWVMGEMQRRYEEYASEEERRKAGIPLIVVVVDEFQEFTVGMMKDGVVSGMLKRIAQQGRAALVHIFLGTHHPVQETFGDKVLRQLLVGRAAFNVMNRDASRVIIGSPNPRADLLAGKGDAYFVTPIGCQRAQGAWIPPDELEELPGGGPMLAEWPPFDPSSLEMNLPAERRVSWSYEGPEIGIALVRAHLDEGRTRLIKALKADGYSAGAVRATRLQDLTRGAYQWMREAGWGLCQTDVETPLLPPPEEGGRSLDEWASGLLGDPGQSEEGLPPEPDRGTMGVEVENGV